MSVHSPGADSGVIIFELLFGAVIVLAGLRAGWAVAESLGLGVD